MPSWYIATESPTVMIVNTNSNHILLPLPICTGTPGCIFNKYCGPGIVPPPNIFLWLVTLSPPSLLLSSKKPFKLVALPASLPVLLSFPNSPNSEELTDDSGSREFARAYADPRRRTMEDMMARKITRARDRAVYIKTIGRDCCESCRPRPPDMSRRVSARLDMGAWRRGTKRWRVARGRTGRMDRRTMGAMEMKARIWWGVLNALDWVIVSDRNWLKDRDNLRGCIGLMC